MTICLFGIYDRNYSRNRVVINGFIENNVEIIEINDRSKGIIKYFKLISKFLKNKEKFDYLWVAFPGQTCVFLAKLLTKKKIIFDCFTSHYQGLVEDRKVIRKNSFKAKINFWLDKYSCKFADTVILDTNEHIRYFIETFRPKPEKIIRLLVGSDDNVFYPRDKEASENFIVHWHGHYIPLQGAEFIIEAANLLKNEGSITFNLIGRGQEFNKCKSLAEKHALENINFIDNVSYEALADYLAGADISLGIFGLSHKASLVIPNKVYEAMAMGKALITEESIAVKELLNDRENVLFCQAGSPEDLANKILELKNDIELRTEISKNAYNLFNERLRPKKLIKNLIEKI